MRIILNSEGVKLTNVPDQDELNQEPIYYVYEWYIKDTDKVFYVGKGKGNRYKSPKRSSLFEMVASRFEVEPRIVKEGLTEYEALVFEEELIKQREQEGNVLTNIVSSHSEGVFTDPVLEFMKTPIIQASRVEKRYLGLDDIPFDKVQFENLLKTHIPNYTKYGLGRLYIEGYVDFESTDDFKSVIDQMVSKTTKDIESIGGKVYKSFGKNVKSIILYGHTNHESYVVYKNKGYDVYHLFDVKKFLEERKGE